MYKFSKKSKSRLITCEYDLIVIAHELLKEVDITIIEGYRSPEKQFEFFKKGLSRCDGVEVLSNHNYKPSRAMDLSYYPIDWNDKDSFIEMADRAKRIAKKFDISIRCGVDFKSFFDGPHIELYNRK